jgi:hypothetical protein
VAASRVLTLACFAIGRGVLSHDRRLSTGVIKNWLYPPRSKERKPILVIDGYDRGSRGTGHVRLFTLRRALQAAVVAELGKLGLSSLTSTACSCCRTLNLSAFAAPSRV